eukprot:1160915-Pelagomonas_calceolata.AAC.11
MNEHLRCPERCRDICPEPPSSSKAKVAFAANFAAKHSKKAYATLLCALPNTKTRTHAKDFSGRSNGFGYILAHMLAAFPDTLCKRSSCRALPCIPNPKSS